MSPTVVPSPNSAGISRSTFTRFASMRHRRKRCHRLIPLNSTENATKSCTQVAVGMMSTTHGACCPTRSGPSWSKKLFATGSMGSPLRLGAPRLWRTKPGRISATAVIRPCVCECVAQPLPTISVSTSSTSFACGGSLRT